MQQYAISGEWDRAGGRRRWLEWSQGAPDERFAAGRISQKQLFSALDEGLWGSNPGAGAVVDVWGDGINKLATLAVTNVAVYDSLFGI